MNTGKIINGTALAADLREKTAQAVRQLTKSHKTKPGLAVIIIGAHPASQIYVRIKQKKAMDIGINSRLIELPETISTEELLSKIHQLNRDKTIHGILVQLPLPFHMERGEIANAIDPQKDVDGFHVINAGKLALGLKEPIIPCTPLGCLMLLKSCKSDISGLDALIIGRSNIVGKPLATLLTKENCTVTLAHSRTQNLKDKCLKADILVAAIGRPLFIKGDWIKPGAIVIDVGINRLESSVKNGSRTKLVGDVDFDHAFQSASAITPVPGGVGPMTVAVLLHNTVITAYKQCYLEPPVL